MSIKRDYDDPKPLIDAGWIFNRECACKTNKKYWYRNPNKPGLEVQWHCRPNQFKVKERGLNITKLMSGIFLEAVLKTL